MFLKKALSLCLVSSLLFTGCSAVENVVSESLASVSEELSGGSTGNATEDNATKLSSDATFYNDFLGFSFTVPSGWWLYNTYEDNFDRKQGTTANISTLDAYYGEGYIYLDLLDCANLQYSTRDNHVGINVYAENVDGVSNLDEYYEDNRDYILEPYEDETYEEVSYETIEIGGKPYIEMTVDVIRDQDSYVLTYYFFELNDNYYGTACFSYWPENTSVSDIMDDIVSNNFDFY